MSDHGFCEAAQLVVAVVDGMLGIMMQITDPASQIKLSVE